MLHEVKVSGTSIFDIDQAVASDKDSMEHLSTLSQVVFKADHIYRHHLFCVNYTTYDIHRAQDTINPQTDVSQSEGLGWTNNHNQHNKGL